MERGNHVEHRISAGSIAIKDDSILLVRHYEEGVYNFWVPPGGGVEKNETLLQCAKRETFEETAINVVPKRIVYLEQFILDDCHFVKSWIVSDIVGGSISSMNKEDNETFLVDAKFVKLDQLAQMNVYPKLLSTPTFLEDVEKGFPEFRYLGLTPKLV